MRIRKANWYKGAWELVVEATSTLQPCAELTVDGYGPMTYDGSRGRYILTAPAPQRVRRVTVTSDKGGSHSRRVRKKP